MRKYLLPILMFCFWSCEEADEFKMTYSSLSDGGVYNMNSGVLLKFSDYISDDTFDAESIGNLGDLGAVVADTNDVDGTFQKFGIPDYMIRINNSNFIKLNNEPQTFIYNSKTNSCLLVGITSELFPDGTGQGFSPNESNNQLTVGDEKIVFTKSQDNLYNIVPNPYIIVSGFDELTHLRQLRFTHLDEFNIIDIYRIDDDYYIRRLIHNSPESGNAWWDLRDFANQPVSSGFYLYRVGTDTLSNGYLNYSTSGYFSIAVADDEND